MPGKKYSRQVVVETLALVTAVGVTEACLQTGISQKTIQRWVNKEGLPEPKVVYNFPVKFVEASESLIVKVVDKLHLAVDLLDPSDPKSVMVLISLIKLLAEMKSYYDEDVVQSEEEEESQIVRAA